MSHVEFIAPTSAEQAAAALLAGGAHARPLSGGTDLLVQLRSGRLPPGLIVDLKRIPEAIGIRQEGETIVVEITDHGKGIPLQEQSRIFDRFYRSPSVKQQIPGSGLGLSIAHSIVRAHNGDLTVASRPGETTFRVTLPVHHKGESS